MFEASAYEVGFGTPCVVGIPPTKTFTIVFISYGKHLTVLRHLTVSIFAQCLLLPFVETRGRCLVLIHLFTFVTFRGKRPSTLTYNRPCKWFTIYCVTPRDWNLLGTKRD